MYVDFKEDTTVQSGFGGGLLWMLSGVMMGLLVGLAMYYFANRGVPSVETASASQGEQASKVVTTKAESAKDKPVTSPFGASKDSNDPEELMVASLIDKNHKDEAKERPSFSYYAVLPDLNVPIQTIKNPSEKEVREKKEREEKKKLALLAAEKKADNDEDEDTDESTVENTKVVADKLSYLLQVASYRKRNQADRTRGRLKRKGMRSYVEKRTVKGSTWFRVMAGPVGSSELEDWKSTVASLGHDPLIYPTK
ncbi:MAG: SPOR domain-containing protein [Cocleimonas sp.]|nr:SPOR domain-containing protein [Cocleimonas sp.]